MSSVNVSVSWKGKVFEVVIETTSDALKLKESLFNLSGVPIEKQKITAKSKGLWKGFLKDTEDFAKFSWENGMKLTMIGNAESVPKNAAPVTFVEDMTPIEKQKFGKKLPVGLENLGNTCFMNSVLQVLRKIPEFRSQLNGFTKLADNVPSFGEKMTLELKNLFKSMDTEPSTSYMPISFVNSMRSALPQFAQRVPGDSKSMLDAGWAQQDADDFYLEFLRVLCQYVPSLKTLFEVQTCFQFVNKEDNSEKGDFQFENMMRVQCKINDKVTTLEEGLELFLNDEVERYSEKLERNAVFSRSQRLDKILPHYLTIQFNRFFWKLTPNSRDHSGVPCKIRKRVKFPLVLDMYPFMSDDLKKSEFVDEIRMFELYGIVTHKGRSSNSGHYMGWVKKDDEGEGSKKWVCFDDEHPSECDEEEVLKLCGDTADYHIAYMAFYRQQKPKKN